MSTAVETAYVETVSFCNNGRNLFSYERDSGHNSHETSHLSCDLRDRSSATVAVLEFGLNLCKQNGAFLSSHKNGKSGKGSGKLFTQSNYDFNNESVVLF